MPGSGLTVETNPLSIPIRNVVLRGRMLRWECPVILKRYHARFCVSVSFRTCGGATTMKRARCRALPAKDAGSPHKAGQSPALQNKGARFGERQLREEKPK